jgi:phosphoribosylaminoimidazolecarboxamide formyltransferase/IMP cyclohydrolase
MMTSKKITSALISVFDKTGLEPIVKKLHQLGVTIYSTGGTEKFISDLDIPVIPVEKLTSYPSILGGRVKTLHPKVFGGILHRGDFGNDKKELEQFEIPSFDLVIVDLYPFEKTVASGATHSEIIEKIDIGGISLIRAAAKNFQEVLCVSSVSDYSEILELLNASDEGSTTLETRKIFAAKAFHVSSHYDTAIFNFMNAGVDLPFFKFSAEGITPLRYGENPHQPGQFVGDLSSLFNQIQGKQLSYNNLLDTDAAVQLISEFKDDEPTFAILKHNNACGLATRPNLSAAFSDALAGDPVSAFGGVLISNRVIDIPTAEKISQLFCEVLIAPSFEQGALDLLEKKKNLIILEQKPIAMPNQMLRSCLNGILIQDRDCKTDLRDHLKAVTAMIPSESEINDLIFASKICKHTKSNTIVLAKGQQLCASGTGQTSRVDALRQAIHKAQSFGMDLTGAAMASDAFFPFPDCVEIAHEAGIKAVIQPGGSIKDQLSIDYCNNNNLSMVFTGTRHFKH